MQKVNYVTVSRQTRQFCCQLHGKQVSLLGLFQPINQPINQINRSASQLAILSVGQGALFLLESVFPTNNCPTCPALEGA